MTATTPFSWSSPHWGESGFNVHVAAWAPDRHTEEPNDE